MIDKLAMCINLIGLFTNIFICFTRLIQLYLGDNSLFNIAWMSTSGLLVIYFVFEIRWIREQIKISDLMDKYFAEMKQQD